MSEAFAKMNNSLECNLNNVNNHIKEVQSGNIDAEAPKIEPLGDIMNEIAAKIGNNLSKKVLSQAFKAMVIPPKE